MILLKTWAALWERELTLLYLCHCVISSSQLQSFIYKHGSDIYLYIFFLFFFLMQLLIKSIQSFLIFFLLFLLFLNCKKQECLMSLNWGLSYVLARAMFLPAVLHWWTDSWGVQNLVYINYIWPVQSMPVDFQS